MLFFNWICAKMVGFNKKLLSRVFLFLRVTANPRCFVLLFTAFSIRDIRLRTEVCDSSDSKKTKSLGYIRVRVAGARARSRPGYRDAQHKGARALAFFILELVFCEMELSFWAERKILCRFSANFSLFGAILRYIHIEGGARKKQDANKKRKMTWKSSSLYRIAR